MKNYKKKILALILCVVLAFGGICTDITISASETLNEKEILLNDLQEESSGSCGENMTWRLDANGTLYISGAGNSTSYETPEDEPWYTYRNRINNIIIEDGPQNIYLEFQDLVNLKTVSISSTVCYFEGYTKFLGCEKLVSFKVAENNKVYNTINDSLVSKNLSDLIIVPKGIQGKYQVPDEIKSIYAYAFNYCNQIDSVTIGAGLEFFYGCYSTIVCENIKEINVVENNPNYASVDGVVYSKDKTKLLAYPMKKRGDFLIPQSVKDIEYQAFYRCQYLETISLPDGLTTISSNAFCDCEKLSEIFIPDSVVNMGGEMKAGYSGIFNKCPKLISAGPVGGKYNILFGWKSTIPELAFCGLDLIEVEIPQGIEKIGERAFLGCRSITEISLPESITEIDMFSFSGCNALKKMYFNGDCPNIDATALYNVTANAYYPSYNSSWINSKLIDYGGSIVWIEKTIQRSINEMEISLSQEAYIYDGTAKQPSVTVKDGSKTLEEGKDYSITYSNNVNVGTATVTITGMGNYEGTVTKTFTINAKIVEKKPFVWGESNWNFDNTSQYFLNYDVNSDVMNLMKKDFNLSNSDIYELKEEIADDNKSGFNGSCFGMTISEILAHQGELKLSRYGGNDIVNKNTNTSNMTSVINFIQELQSNSKMCQSIRQTPFLKGDWSQEEFISKLSDVAANADYFVKLSYKIVTQNINNGLISDGYHAVLVYGIDKCNFYSSVTGKTYDRKILIADPNYLSGNSIDDNACLYFKSSDSSWIIPYWNKTYSNGDVDTCYWNAESGESTNNGGIRNIMQYVSLKEEVDLMAEYNAGHYIAGLAVENLSENISMVEKVKDSGNPNIDYAGNFSEEIARYDIDMDDDIYMTENDELYALWNPTASYTLSYLKPSDYNLKMDYETVDYYADVTNSIYTLFKPNGSIELRGEDASYDITMVTDDEDCVTDWYAVNVSGSGVDNLVYTKAENGYVLSASELKDVKISAEGEESSVDVTFSTNYDDVFIYEVDKNTIGVAVDTDNNGSYETAIDMEENLDPTDEPSDPVSTEEPNVTTSPVSTEEPNATMAPISTKEPDVTMNPVSTEKPKTAASPILMNKPNTTTSSLKGTILKDSQNISYKVVIPGRTVELYRINNKKAAKIIIPAMVKINGITYKVTAISNGAFSGCKKLKVVTIGQYVTSIGDKAFFQCLSLKKITIPVGVTQIGQKAFYGCKNLKNLIIQTKKLTSKKVGGQAFKKIHKKAVIRVPKKQKRAYKKWLLKKGITKKMKIK